MADELQQTSGPAQPTPPRPNLSSRRRDRELEEFRAIMEPPSTFENGFTWPAFFGALFVAVLMVPGTIYMGLLAGGGIGPAAQWVTVILFIEVARRANKFLKRAEIFTLYYLAGAAVASPFTGVLWQQFYVQSNAAQAHGITEFLPSWWAPTDKAVLDSRNLLQPAWLPVIGLIIFGQIMFRLDNAILGYGLFRLTNDVERLPFPMAPVGAQGITALAEEQEEEAARGPEDEAKPQASWRWRVFSIGSVIGVIFGAVYLGLPTVTGALLGTPIQIFPIPWVDFTPQTGNLLPAVPTGLTFDLGQLMLGMVLPWFAMLGSFTGLIISFILNPTLYHYHVLNSFQPGDGTIQTHFKNYVDFYFSFGVGNSLAIASVGVAAMIRAFWEFRRRRQTADPLQPRTRLSPPPGRGDIRPIFIMAAYLATTTIYILVSMKLVGWEHKGVLAVLVFYGFLYTPLISYATARLEGIAGQVVAIPMVKEACFILSGYRGVAVWFIPVPLHDYGAVTVRYRQSELTGTSFWSIWKSELFLFPIILISSLMFAQFIWSLGPIPGPQYPFAQTMWELQAETQSVIFSSTLGGFSRFEQAFDPWILVIGFSVGAAALSSMQFLGVPTFFMYGVIRGLGQVEPHSVLVQFIGALIGRFYFQKRLGLSWRQYVPVVFAGFACGVGLVTTLGVGFTFLSKAVFKLPF